MEISLLRKPLFTDCALSTVFDFKVITVMPGTYFIRVEEVSGEVPSKVYQMVALSVAEVRVTVCCWVKGPPGGVACGASALGIGFCKMYCFMRVSLSIMPDFLAMALINVVELKGMESLKICAPAPEGSEPSVV